MTHPILVVDDEPRIRDLLASALEREGFRPLVAESAEQALDILQREDVHVIFVDIQLTGMNGVEFCRRVRRDRPIDCLFAVTGHTSLFDLVTCREAGFDDYFTKPFDIAVLTRAARDAVARIERWRRPSGSASPKTP